MRPDLKLNLPEFDIRLRTVRAETEIWDAIRKRWLKLTPEEWVRQHFIRYLVEVKGVNPLFVRQDLPLRLNETGRRADIVVYGQDGRPRMVVECKAPEVRIVRETLEQVGRYNMVLKVPCVAVTNGLTHYCFRYDAAAHRMLRLEEIPVYDTLNGWQPASE